MSNTLLFSQPRHVTDVKEDFDLKDVSLITTPNLYPLVKGIEINKSSDEFQKRYFPVKRKMDDKISAFEADMLRHWNQTKERIRRIVSKIKPIKKVESNNMQTLSRIALIPNAYKKEFAQIADKYDLNLSLLDKIVINSSLLVNARYDNSKNLIEVNPDYLKQHGMIRIGDATSLISETEKTFIHEFGHVFWYQSLTEEDRHKFQSLATFLIRDQLTGDMQQFLVGEKKRFDGSTVYSPYYTRRDDSFVSIYARFNIREDFSECFLYYKVAPSTLKKMNPDKFEFMEEKIGNQLQKDSMTKADIIPREIRDAMISELDDLNDDLSDDARKHYVGAYNLGRQKGAFYSFAAYVATLSAQDKERLQALYNRNDTYLDGFTDLVLDDLDENLFVMSPTGMIEDVKEFESADEIDGIVDDVMDSYNHRVGLYSVNGLSMAMMTGLAAASVGLVGGTWHTAEDDRVCNGCESLDGKWMSYIEFFMEFGNQDCDGNCRCGDLFEPSIADGDETEKMVKGYNPDQERDDKGQFASGGGSVASGEYVYHVTKTENVSKIKEKGILPLQTTNWVRAGDKSRYGKGEIYAFENITDAARWAGKMDWEFNKDMGSGKISIIRIKNTGDWNKDENDPLGQAGAKGSWLTKPSKVGVEHVHDHIPVTTEITRRLVNDGNVDDIFKMTKVGGGGGQNAYAESGILGVSNVGEKPEKEKLVAVDYHGTICSHSGVLLPGIAEKLLEFKRAGYKIVVWTAGINKNPSILNGVRVFLDANHVVYDEIWARQGKPDADVYIDDKSFNPTKENIKDLEV